MPAPLARSNRAVKPDGTRVEQLIGRIRHWIEQGLLKPGDRLLSVRAGATEQGVSKNTMAEAYDRLVAQGLLEARRGSGYYVSRIARPAFDELQPHVVEAIDTVSFLREQLEQSQGVRVGDGRPPPAWMEGSELGKHLKAIRPNRHVGFEHGYGSPWGFAPLRERIALMLNERAIVAAPNQVLLTQGANNALDLLVRHLCDAGDTVLVESPGYYPLFAKLKLARVNTVSVRRRVDGPDLDELAAKVTEHRPKVFFTQSLAHNPTGGSLSLPVAHRVMKIAARHGVTIVEDDPFADVLPSSAPRLAALDQFERVIYVGSFSKTMSASLRVGYIAAARPLVAALCDLKMVTQVSTSDFVERIVYDLVASGHYLRHLRRLRVRIEQVTAIAIDRLARIGLAPFAPGAGGYYLWVLLPAGIDDRQLAREAAERGIFLAPGSVFLPDRATEASALRVNVAYADDPGFLGFMAERLGR
ncbi:MAG: PLP-dependent aminotransferase family protein [Lautropia sp.]|nr:MAG: PLP-dependent aminotransferase family protein [Pseudomonadota bacterium]MBC6958799.1 PLP-dependent aminotransferase family protein [Lautropia sp.]MDL1907813.1 PLP-dependent aminotransferase family protein [Betaproteobacteria bacterium PRO1]RIK89373.1 MAG: PLP-dependent aminotransferase family protein [Burkholderiales bacterium]